jgi:hypothetical protein
MSNYSTALHVVKQALRASGYEEDANSALHAYFTKITQTGAPKIQVLVIQPDCNAIVYLEQGADGTWLAEY